MIAEDIALGTVHLTGHSQQTGLCWASVPRDFVFLPCSHLVASSRASPVGCCRKQRGRSNTSPREALPAWSTARHWVAAVPPSKPLPVGTGCALCSQLLDSSPSCCSQEATASPIRPENAFWFNKDSFNVSNPLSVRREEMKVCHLGKFTEEISHW